ncbi:SMP-30/gluconolactonase/LRE family protein [Tsuneonella mangrovi]|uniref:SMP-30/gluconolactonase/LRE family protein n=1 Tax=Tsuneonella mangrovi TaxID=1982042 RepID=UPI001470C851|nr:SMP-30/gluconolactonase/LRE family protein [Tsuneonella mangrovi]
MDDQPEIFDQRRCELGESPLWHPELQTLFWVDILRNAVLWNGQVGIGEAIFERPVSALAHANRGDFVMADDAGLFLWSHISQDTSPIVALEADVTSNRANDGRADPWGGFWIGTMDREANGPTGAIYRWFKGDLRRIVDAITIPNGLCFDRARNRAYFTDTPTHRIFRVDCDDSGWPISVPRIHIDLGPESLLVDGAVIDRLGNIRAACWDASVVIAVSPDGELVGRRIMPTQRPTSVVFGSNKEKELFVTTAAIDLQNDLSAGMTLHCKDKIGGFSEPHVIIP